MRQADILQAALFASCAPRAPSHMSRAAFAKIALRDAERAQAVVIAFCVVSVSTPEMQVARALSVSPVDSRSATAVVHASHAHLGTTKANMGKAPAEHVVGQLASTRRHAGHAAVRWNRMPTTRTASASTAPSDVSLAVKSVAIHALLARSVKMDLCGQ